MPFFDNVAVSVITRQEGDTSRTITYPPLKNNSENISEHIKDAVYRCMNLTSKQINFCELSGEYYSDDDNSDQDLEPHEEEKGRLLMTKLIGADHINNHHCSGNIIYHSSKSDYVKDANMYFEWQESIIQKQSWDGKKVKIERSNQEIMEANIVDKSGLRYNKDRGMLMMYVEFINNSELLYKWVPLTNYQSKSLKREVKGILELNPNLLEENLILTIDEHPEWMNEERDELKKLMQDELNKTNLKFVFKIQL